MKGLSAGPSKLYKSYLQDVVEKGLQYVVGSGSFSTIVRVCEDKVVRHANNDIDTNEFMVVSQLSTLSNTGNYSTNVVNVYSSFQKYQLLEYITCSLGGESFSVDLTEFVENNVDPTKRLFLVKRDAYFTQLHKGIRWLHENNIFHRDICTNNLVISGDMSSKTVIKIIDFNLSIVIPYRKKIKIRNSPVPFRHPGSIGTHVFKSLPAKNFDQYIDQQLDEQKYSEFKEYLSASDFWSATVVCFILVNGQKPWTTHPNSNILKQYFSEHNYQESDNQSNILIFNTQIKNMFEGFVEEESDNYYLKKLSLEKIIPFFVTLQEKMNIN